MDVKTMTLLPTNLNTANVPYLGFKLDFIVWDCPKITFLLIRQSARGKHE